MINLLTLDLGDMDLTPCLLQIFHVTLMYKYPRIWPLASVLEFMDCKIASPCLSGQGEKNEGTCPQLDNPRFFARQDAGLRQEAQKMTGREYEVCVGEKVMAKYFVTVLGCCRHVLEAKAVGCCGDEYYTSTWKKQGYFQEPRPQFATAHDDRDFSIVSCLEDTSVLFGRN